MKYSLHSNNIYKKIKPSINMLNKKEIIAIISATLVLGIIISLLQTWEIFFITTGLVLIVILINVTTKKITSFYLDTELEISLWEFIRYGYKKHQHFKKPIPAGILIPLAIKFLSVGLLNWMACITFEIKGKVYRAARRHGIYSFSEITEKEIAWIASAGIIANIIFALVGYLTGYLGFAKLNLGFAFYNLIPISNLDGAKILFSNRIIWITLAIITSIGVIGPIILI